MRKLLLILGIILAIIIAFISSLNWDYVSSVIPGWHTTIYPLWFLLLLLTVPILVIILLIKIFKVIIKRK